ncbi:MAG TPA: PEP-CTERM sorting domain-containing protein [Chthoniobacteraceae bacterium]|nr:PEP-CTERM sorting domain-containing protein [Chthoniobacteraceae bacterium]
MAYTLTIGLGVTARTPLSPGTGFATGATTVFNGTAETRITMAREDFDLTITLDTPFLYDPALGNLLLDITVVSATKPNNGDTYGYFAYATGTNDLARIYNGRSGVVAENARGLVTQFTVNPVPEPATAALLFLGTAFCIPRRVRASLRSS